MVQGRLNTQEDSSVPLNNSELYNEMHTCTFQLIVVALEYTHC